MEKREAYRFGKQVVVTSNDSSNIEVAIANPLR